MKRRIQPVGTDLGRGAENSPPAPGLVLPRLVDSLVVRLRLCWDSPGPVPVAWLCVWGGGEDEMEAWEPVLLPWFSSFSRSFSAFSFSISSCVKKQDGGMERTQRSSLPSGANGCVCA